MYLSILHKKQFLPSKLNSTSPLEVFYDKVTISMRETLTFPRTDKDFLKKLFAFNLSKKDEDIFLLNYLAWQKIASSESEYAIIIDGEVDIIADIETIYNNIESYEEDWDVFFPFDKSEMVDYSNYQPTHLGIYWGCKVYFLSKNGALKLLKHAVLRQSVDDEILYLSSLDLLNTYAENTGFFNIKNDSLEIPLYKKESIYKALELDRQIAGEDLSLAHTILNTLSTISNERKFYFILFGGSLLGHIRHGGIMPWDDDIDLALDIEKVLEMLDVLSQFEELIIKKSYLPGAKWHYYKVWHKNGKAIPGHQHTFPFVDIWLYRVQKSTINFLGGEIFDKHEYMPFQNILFENNVFFIPKNPLNALDKQYRNWRNQIQRFAYSHREERFKYKLFALSITVDESGKLVGFS